MLYAIAMGQIIIGSDRDRSRTGACLDNRRPGNRRLHRAAEGRAPLSKLRNVPCSKKSRRLILLFIYYLIWNRTRSKIKAKVKKHANTVTYIHQ